MAVLPAILSVILGFDKSAALRVTASSAHMSIRFGVHNAVCTTDFRDQMQQSKLGILSLDTAFPRIRGDVGNADSYPFDVIIEIVKGADSPLIVRDGVFEPALLDLFKAAAVTLEAKGAAAIISTCGFLVAAQTQIAASVKVPVMLSALSLYPMVRTAYPGRVGILTASRSALGPNALAAAGIARADVAIAGMEDEKAFADAILVTRAAQPQTLNRAAIEDAAVRKTLKLQESYADLRALILECGNLPPYADAIRRATGLPVFHLLDAAGTLVAGRAVGGQLA